MLQQHFLSGVIADYFGDLFQFFVGGILIDHQTHRAVHKLFCVGTDGLAVIINFTGNCFGWPDISREKALIAEKRPFIRRFKVANAVFDLVFC